MAGQGPGDGDPLGPFARIVGTHDLDGGVRGHYALLQSPSPEWVEPKDTPWGARAVERYGPRRECPDSGGCLRPTHGRSDERS